MNVTRHVSLVIRWCGQIGSAGSESIIVTAANVPIARVVVAAAGRGWLLEIGIEFFFVLPLANFLDDEEDGAYDDGGTDQADDGEGRAHSRLVLQKAGNEVSITITMILWRETDELPDPVPVPAFPSADWVSLGISTVELKWR